MPYEFVSRRPGDVACVAANNIKATSILNWSPKDLLLKCVEWLEMELNKNKLFSF